MVRVLAPREFRARYRQSVLNVAWAIISPVAILAVYGLVLTESFGVTSTCAPYLVTAWTGMVVWTYFSTAISGATTSLIQSADMISRLYFPREALPLGVSTAALVDLGVGMVTLVGVALVQGVTLGPTALLSVFPIIMIVLWTSAIGIFAGVLAAFSRDVLHLVSLGLRVGFFATPVMYEAALVPSQFAWTAKLNPVAVAITELRNVLLCGGGLSPRLVSVHILAGAVVLAAAVVYTRSVEARAVDVI